jgi:hypothetical protein
VQKHLASLLFGLIAVWSSNTLAATTLIDLDSAPGNYSVWKVSDLSTNSVTFDATYAAIKKHAKWAPSYSIALSDGHGQSIKFTGTFQGSDAPETNAVISKDGKDISSTDSILAFNLKDRYNVSLAWSDKAIKVSANGVTKSYPVNFNPTEIEIICSTGELEVKNIVFNSI